MIDHVMVDLETADNGPRSAIIAIGATCFWGPHRDQQFYQAIDLNSNWSAGLTMGADTMAWWDKQSPEARAVFTDPNRIPLARALTGFAHWLRPFHEPRIWGNGAAFDNVILRSAYEAIGQKAPWPFWNDRCFRTIKAIVGKSVDVEGVAHNALADAIAQANYLLKYMEWILE